MAKWCGNIGYAETVETEPGIYEEQIIERPYFGDTIKNTRLLQNSGVGTNDNINVSMQFSIVSDPYAMNNFHTMRYIVFMGSKWKITNVEVQYPRLILTVGGLYV